MARGLGVASWAAWLGIAYLTTLSVAAHAQETQPSAGPPIKELFRKVVPSVVAIRARGHDRMAPGEARITERGSGVLIAGNGVLTAAYVVHDMKEISVEFPNGETVSARVVASQPEALDLSLLQLERVPSTAIASPMGDSNTVKVGDTVLIVGAPDRSPHSLKVGAIKARWAPNTAYRAMPMAEFFQTDAAIDPENSGGPMFNLKGEVIGVVSHNISRGDRSAGQGFVVTVNTAKRLLLQEPAASSHVALESCSSRWRRC
jgi:serine protease Do